MAEEADYRLPRNVVPVRYDLELAPDLESFTFDGHVSIAVAVADPTSEFVLNAIELEIDEAYLAAADGRVVGVGDVEYLTAAERIIVRFTETVPTGEWQLVLRFRGVLNDRLHGFYRSTYTDSEGVERVLATTQFEATDARRAFPCWDEPDLKAVFGVTLIVPEHLAAVSSGPVIREESLGDGRRKVVFADTMVMSTYLLAFIVGDLEATDPVDVDGVPLRVLHTPGHAALTGFALEAGSFALRYFAEYYGVPYPGDKLDMIAIPDFSAGAMENLGAITFRETLLLIDPAKATQAELKRVADVIAHEIAHMWFGDLVTMRWWNGTWLKEAFATFMEMKCTDAFRPEWKTWIAFGPTRNEAMEIDALSTTRSIEYPVHSPEDANAMFDTITYEKGSAVLRMFEQYLGEEVFRRGISRYLHRHAFGNTDTADLWNALEQTSGEPVGTIAHSWIFDEGFPQVQVETGEGGVVMSRQRFTYLGAPDGRWKVPVLYRGAGELERILVDEPVDVDPDGPLVVNAGGSGFYRTRYDAPLLEDAVDRRSELTSGERYALISDVWAQVLAGDTPASAFLTLVTTMSEEREPPMWEAAIAGLDELDRIASSDDRAALSRVARRVLSPIADEAGWSPVAGESDVARRLRGLVLTTLGTLGRDPATAQEAEAMVDRWFTDADQVDADVAAASLLIVGANGDREHFGRFLAARTSVARPQDAVRLLRAAAAVPDPATARELLQMVIDGRVRRQDAYWVVARLLGHRDVGPDVWSDVRSRWSEVLDAMPPQNTRLMLDRIHLRSEPEVAGDIEAWLAANPIKGSEQLVAQQVERLQVRVGLRARERNRLGEALARLE